MAAASAAEPSLDDARARVKARMDELSNLKAGDTNHDFRQNDCLDGRIVTRVRATITDDEALKGILGRLNFEDLALIHFFKKSGIYQNIKEVTLINDLSAPSGDFEYNKLRIQPSGPPEGYHDNLKRYVLYVTDASSYNEVYVVNDGVKPVVLVNGGMFEGDDSAHFVQSIARRADSATMVNPVGNRRYIAKSDSELLYVKTSYNQLTGLFEKDTMDSSFRLDGNYGELGNNLDNFTQHIRSSDGGEITVLYHNKNSGPSIRQQSHLYCTGGSLPGLANAEADMSPVVALVGGAGGADYRGWFLDEKRAGDYRQVLLALRLSELGKKVLFVSIDRLAVALAVILGVPAGMIGGGNTGITLFRSTALVRAINPADGVSVARYEQEGYKNLLERLVIFHSHYAHIRAKLDEIKSVLDARLRVRVNGLRQASPVRSFQFRITTMYDIVSTIRVIRQIDTHITEVDRLYTSIHARIGPIGVALGSIGTTAIGEWNDSARTILGPIGVTDEFLLKLELFTAYKWIPSGDINNISIKAGLIEYDYGECHKMDKLVKKIATSLPPTGSSRLSRGASKYNYVKKLSRELYSFYLEPLADDELVVLLNEMSRADFLRDVTETNLTTVGEDSTIRGALEGNILPEPVSPADIAWINTVVPAIVPPSPPAIVDGIRHLDGGTEQDARTNDIVGVLRNVKNCFRNLLGNLSQVVMSYRDGMYGRARNTGSQIGKGYSTGYIDVYLNTTNELLYDCLYLGILSRDSRDDSFIKTTSVIIGNVVIYCLATMLCLRNVTTGLKLGSKPQLDSYLESILRLQGRIEFVSDINGSIIPESGAASGTDELLMRDIAFVFYNNPRNVSDLLIGMLRSGDEVLDQLVPPAPRMSGRKESGYVGEERRGGRGGMYHSRRIGDSRRRGGRTKPGYAGEERRGGRGVGREWVDDGGSDDEDRGGRGMPRDEDRRGSGANIEADVHSIMRLLTEKYSPHAAAAAASAASPHGSLEYDRYGVYRRPAAAGPPGYFNSLEPRTTARLGLVFGRKMMPSQTKRRGDRKHHRGTKRQSRKCPRGTIRRKAYKTKRGITVRSSCIKDRGLPGKGKRLFTLQKGGLSKYGYSLKDSSKKTRRTALNKARKTIPHATLVRKVNALSVLMKNTHPKYAARARADVKWLGKTQS